MEVSNEVSMEQAPLAPQPTVFPQITVVIFMATLTQRSVSVCAVYGKKTEAYFLRLTSHNLSTVRDASHVSLLNGCR